MSTRLQLFAISVLLFGLLAEIASAMECKVCHSKNPAMVKMHKSTQASEISCFDCHKIGEKLMGKGQPKDKESQLKRRTTETICKKCHQ
ncbi:MAG TPA: cytochrome C [Geobacteraceae bacterium]|nr:cytochrome C [Geobacteraceae bacterium]